jgi:hypothetical protein
MPRASSADRRERVLADREAGLGRAEVARRCRIGERTVYRRLHEARHQGRREAEPHAGGRRHGGCAPRAGDGGDDGRRHARRAGRGVSGAHRPPAEPLDPVPRLAAAVPRLAAAVPRLAAAVPRLAAAVPRLAAAVPRLAAAGADEKKRPRAPPSGTGRRSGPSGRRSSNGCAASTRAGWCSWMRPG